MNKASSFAGGDIDSLAEDSVQNQIVQDYTGSNRVFSNNGYDFLIDDEYQALKAS